MKNVLHTAAAVVAATLLCGALSACDKKDPPVPKADAPAPGAVSVAATPAVDPSLPSTAVAAASAASAPGDRPASPLSDLSKADESTAMPKEGQPNSHSSAVATQASGSATKR